jgi:hypothetical protein
MPDAFGPAVWRCSQCGFEEAEPRLACGHCGSVQPLSAVGLRHTGFVALPEVPR